jgi:O-methyltransferase
MVPAPALADGGDPGQVALILILASGFGLAKLLVGRAVVFLRWSSSAPASGKADGMLGKRWLGSGLRLAQRLVNARSLLFGAYEPEISEVIQKVKPFTMTSPARVAALCDAVAHVVRHGVQGDFVECGVWKGGSAMAAALRLMQLNAVGRPLLLFDTFEGMTPPSEIDRSGRSGFSAAALLKSAPEKSHIAARAPIEEVRQNMASTGYPPNLVHLVRGPVEETLPDRAPERIAVLRLDTDWYDSTRHELLHLYPRLAAGGILIIDDYGDWQGARKAVDEYFDEQKIPIFLHRIDHTGRIAVKP